MLTMYRVFSCGVLVVIGFYGDLLVKFYGWFFSVINGARVLLVLGLLVVWDHGLVWCVGF